ncbi:MAG: FHA domain-containing protein [Candidatus Rokuibacteriota bacterium]
MPKLTLVMERTPIQVYELTRPVIQIGRIEGMDIVIDNVSVSRQQAEIRQQGRAWVVRDLASSNGTFLNGQRIAEPQPLKRGDEISFGKFSLFFERELDEPLAEARILPAMGKANPSGTYHMSAEEVDRLQELIAAKRQAQLDWEVAGLRGTHAVSGESLVVGTARDADVRVPGGPGRAVRISRGPRGYEARNATPWYQFTRMKVNGQAMSHVALKTGDEIEIGLLRLTFRDAIR